MPYGKVYNFQMSKDEKEIAVRGCKEEELINLGALDLRAWHAWEGAHTVFGLGTRALLGR